MNGAMIMKKAITALSLATALFIPGISSAADLNYDFVELQYSQTDLDLYSDDLTGFDINLNKSLSNNIYLLLDYSSGSINTILGDLDASGIAVGVGIHAVSIINKTDLVTELAVIKGDIELAGVSVDANGYGIAAGLRSKLTDRHESLIFISYTDVEDETDTSIEIALAYEIIPSLQITAGADFEDENTLSIGLRLNY